MKRWFLFCFYFTCNNPCIATVDSPDDGIDHIYVISLDCSIYKWQATKAQLEKVGLKPTRFRAIDGRNIQVIDNYTGAVIPRKDFHKKRNHNTSLSVKYNGKIVFTYEACPRILNSGEFGCFLSHRAIWNDILKKGYKNVLVFEDDIILHEDFRKKYDPIMKNIPSDCDIFFLDVGMSELDKSRKIITYFLPPYFWLRGLRNTRSSYFAKANTHSSFWGTYAYCITNTGARKLLKYTAKSKRPIDLEIFSLADKLNIYISKIKLLSSGVYNSDIAVIANEESGEAQK